MPVPGMNLQDDPQFASAVAPLATPAADPAVPTVTPTITSPAAPASQGPSAPLVVAPSSSSTGPKLGWHEKLAQEAQKLTLSNPVAASKPGAFGRIIVGAAINALSGADTVLSSLAPEADVLDPNSGAGVLARTAANIAAQRKAAADAAAKVKQQAFENARETASDQREQQMLNSNLELNKVKMLQAHAAMINTARIASHESDEFHAQMSQSANTLAEPYLEAGAQVMGHDVPESEKDAWLKANAPRDSKSGLPDFSKFISFQDGEVPIVDPKTGKQATDPADGTPAYQRTYQIIEVGSPVELTQSQVALLNKYAPPNQGQWEVGQKLDPQTYALIAKKAQLQETVDLNVEKTRSDIRKNMSDAEKAKADAGLARMTTAQKAQNLATANLFSPYLAIAGGDPILGLDYMLRSKDAKSAQAVERMYGPGVLERARTTNIVALGKTIQDDERQLNDVVTSATMNADDKASLQQELQAARQKRNAYLGLHPNDPDQITQSVLKLDAVDPAKRGQTIFSSKMPNSAKVYLLRHYGLPVPAALLPQTKPSQPAAQPAAPAAQ